MKANNNYLFYPLAARTLKIVGIILILSFLLDFIVLLFPFRIQDRAWQINFASQVIDRGTIPMVGAALILAGYWIDNIANELASRRPLGLSVKFWVLVLASLLGLLFLVLSPLHIHNILQARTEALSRLDAEATQAQAQLQNQISGQQDQLRNQLSSLLQNPQQLNAALQSQQVPEQFKNILRQAQQNPQALDQLISQQLNADTIRNQAVSQIQRRKQQVTEQAQEQVQSGIGSGIRSLLLSIGYILISWTGLRDMRVLQSDRDRYPI